MKMNTMLLNHAVAKSNLHLEDRKYLVALAISRAIGYNLALPTSAVESHSKYFNDTHKDVVENTLVDINEMSVINIQECFELTFKIWKMRYQLVFNPRALDVIKMLDNEVIFGNEEVPQIYSTVVQRVGVDTVKSFLCDVHCAMNVAEEGV